MRKPAGYWDKYENCYEEAKKYKTRFEFRKGNGSAYEVARKKGWLDYYDWLIDGRVKLLTDKNDCVYKYYFPQTNSIYVGRTIDKNDAENRHIYVERDAVVKHAKENGFAVPPMEIIEDNLTIIEGLEREDYWKNYYKDRGYNVLNTGKTGVGSGSIGAIGIHFCKWTKEKVFEEAKQYKTKSEFKKENGTAYNKALKKGWLKEMTWFVSGQKNNVKKSKPIIQYTKNGQFMNEYPSIMEAVRQTGYGLSNICNCCKGKIKTAYGSIWKYA